jgi:predicted Zn-dependent protease
LRTAVAFFALAACGVQPGGASLTFDPCGATQVAAPAATADQLASVDDALALWRADGVRGLSRGDAAEVAIEFRAAGASIYGFYDDTTATLYVNVRLTDRAQRAITIAHELGHALGLAHVPAAAGPSVMNPGNLTVAPNPADLAALAAKWGACPATP